MSATDDDVTTALSALRTAVAGTVSPPPAALLRQRAEHRQRVRTAVRSVAVAAMVVGVVVGAATVVGGRAHVAPPPSSPSQSPTSVPSPIPRPSREVPPYPTTTVTDPIASVDWSAVTVTVPPRSGCPTGEVTFPAGIARPGDPVMAFSGLVRYGDLIGDSRPEAILRAICGVTEEGDDYPAQLLVVARDQAGTLTGIGWVGPVGALYRDAWVVERRLIVEARPIYNASWDYWPGSALAYEWDGGSFEPVPSGYPGIGPVDGLALGPVIDLGPATGYVATRLGCPGGPVRLSSNPTGGPVEAAAGDVVYNVEQPEASFNVTHLVDLAGDGHRYVVLAMLCRDATVPRDQAVVDGVVRGQGIIVLDQRPDGSFLAIDVVAIPAGRSPSSWELDRGRLTAPSTPAGGGIVEYGPTWTWNGTNFQP